MCCMIQKQIHTNNFLHLTTIFGLPITTFGSFQFFTIRHSMIYL